MRIALPGWRSRLVIDAYARLPDGEGTQQRVMESYVALAEARGHTVPKDIAAGIRDEVHRLSSDSRVFRDWNNRRPDLLQRYEKGRWGLRPAVMTQMIALGIDDESIIAGIPPVQPDDLIPELSVSDDSDDFSSVYVMEMLPITNLIDVAQGRKIIKIGRGGDPFERRKELQTGNPSRIEVLFSANVRNASALENKLHKLGENRRLHGEWFVADTNLREAIGRMISSHGMGRFS